jgi:hypothetical protein
VLVRVQVRVRSLSEPILRCWPLPNLTGQASRAGGFGEARAAWER